MGKKPKPRVHIIMKNKSPEDLLRGLSLDSTQIKRATLAITEAIEKSFKADEKRLGHTVERTAQAIGYRFQIALKVAIRLLGDYYMTTASLRARLPRALASELAGIEYAPADRHILRGP